MHDIELETANKPSCRVVAELQYDICLAPPMYVYMLYTALTTAWVYTVRAYTCPDQ